jgi:hypothetical protein
LIGEVRVENKRKKEDNIVPIHTIKACRGERGIAPLILIHGIR